MPKAEPNTHVASILESHGFGAFRRVQDRASIADLFPQSKRCGIYVLRFATGEHYAGQAVDVVRRYAQHRITHEDLIELAFLKATKQDLNRLERDVIWALDRSGVPLRNITFTSSPVGSSDLDLVLHPDAQDAFIAASDRADEQTVRPISDDLRRKYQRKFSQFQQLPDAERVMAFLRGYVGACIPKPRLTEISFWACSCLPDQDVWSRVNINWQEVVTVFDWKSPGVSFHLARTPLEAAYGTSLSKLRAGRRTIWIEDHRYDPGGSDQVYVGCENLKAAQELLTLAPFVGAARLFNLRLMRKGPCTFGRYHCPQLADRLVD